MGWPAQVRNMNNTNYINITSETRDELLTELVTAGCCWFDAICTTDNLVDVRRELRAFARESLNAVGQKGTVRTYPTRVGAQRMVSLNIECSELTDAQLGERYRRQRNAAEVIERSLFGPRD